MAKVSEKAREIYQSKLKVYKKKINAIQESEKAIKSKINQNDPKKNYYKLKLSDMAMNCASFYIIMNSLSIHQLGVKNESYLDEGRKYSYKAVIYLEEIFSNYIDAPYHDYEEGVKSVNAFPESDRYKLVKKLGLCIDILQSSYGENSKWKHSLMELKGRMAVLSKNILDLKKFVAGLDLHAKGYPERVQYKRLVTSLFEKSSEEYRRKYELTTRRIDDFKKAINYLQGLRRFYAITGDSRQADALKKKIEVWTHKMNTDLERDEKEAARRRLKK